MKLDTEFYKLPLLFEAERLIKELGQFSENEWRAHPTGFPGNSAISLISVNGDPADDSLKGATHPTPYLERCPYLKQVLTALNSVFGLKTHIPHFGL